MSGRDGFGAWLEDRTGIGSAIGAFLNKKVPPRLPLSYTLGGVALLLLGVQMVTGFFLAVYYAPTPDHAHDSIRFIERSITGGRLLRGIHHWGASFMVVAVVLHLLRSFLFGSYKKPREMTWIIGGKLLFLTLAFGLTGYLLPWDQKAYWATMVTLRVAHSVPLIGPLLSHIGAGGETLGALTLTRFFAIHALLLPAATATLVVIHVALVQRHGSTGPPAYMGDPERDGETFHPRQSIRDAAAMLVVFAALLALAWIKGSPLEAPADPSDSTYVPRPEWYFLGLFQFLKYFPGRLEVVGTVILPGIMTALFFLLPFIDRRPERAYGPRRLIIAGGLLVMAAAAVLTLLGSLDRGGAPEPAWKAQGRSPFFAIAGPMVYEARQCASCHRDDGFGAGPPLTGEPRTRDNSWVRAHLSDPEYVAPGAREPDTRLPSSDVAVLMGYLDLLKEGQPPRGSAQEQAAVGLIVHAGCAGCHKLDGVGGTFGPNLAGVGSRHSRQWILDYLPDPTKVDPKARMKAYPDLTLPEREAMTDYILELK